MVSAAAVVAVAALVLVTTHGHPRRVARGPLPSAQPVRHLFAGVPASSAPADDRGDRMQRYMNDGTVIDGVPLRVVELTGEPGDVIPHTL